MRRARPGILALLLLSAATAFARSQTMETRDESISVVSRDGVKLEGLLVSPDAPGPAGAAAGRRPLALLLHAYNRNRDSLLRLGDAMAARGVSSLLMDMRGHGASTTTTGDDLYSVSTQMRKDLHFVVDDQQQILEQLARRTDLDLGRVALVGVGTAALIAAEAGARSPAFRALVLVDPVRASGGFKPDEDLGLYGDRPALLVATAYPQSRAWCAELAGFGGGERTVFESPAFEQIDRMLGPGSPALEKIVDWVAQKLAPPPSRTK